MFLSLITFSHTKAPGRILKRNYENMQILTFCIFILPAYVKYVSIFFLILQLSVHKI